MCVTHKSREKGVREKKIVGYRSAHSVERDDDDSLIPYVRTSSTPVHFYSTYGGLRVYQASNAASTVRSSGHFSIPCPGGWRASDLSPTSASLSL
jgi:hypothetical protein